MARFKIDFVDLNLTDKDYWKVGLSKIVDKAVDAGALRRGVTSQRSAGVRAHRRWAKLRAPILLRPFSRGARRSLAELTGGERSSAAAPREGDTTALVAVVPDGTMAGV